MIALSLASPTDRVAVANVLDGAALETDPDRLCASLERGETVVARSVEDDETPAAGQIVGALVRDGERIVSLAVRRRRRDQGIGTALVERAGEDSSRLVAEFDERVRPFYESLGFDVEPIEDRAGRCRGIGAF